MAAFVAVGAWCCLTGGMLTAQDKAKTDQEFVKDAAQGGMLEVKLGKLATEHAGNDAVKKFGQRMVDDHSKANKELKDLAAKKGITLPTSLDQKHQTMIDKLSKMNGADFDRAYMSAMVKDHQDDVAEFETEARNGKDADIKAWAAKTLPTLREHLKLAQATQGNRGR